MEAKGIKTKETKKNSLIVRTDAATILYISDDLAKSVLPMLKAWNLIRTVPGIVCVGPGPAYEDGKWTDLKASIWLTFNDEFDLNNFSIPCYVTCQINGWKGYCRDL